MRQRAAQLAVLSLLWRVAAGDKCALGDAGAGASLLQVATDRRPVALSSSAAAPPRANGTQLPEVTALLSAMTAAGVTLHPDLEGSKFMHGGYEVRGMRPTKDLEDKATILLVPKVMWIQGTVPPVVEGSDCPSACKHVGDTEMLAQVLQLHEEQRKGAESTFHEYMKALPTLEEYRSFLPSLADASLLQDFHGLQHLVSSVKHHQQKFNETYACIEALKGHVKHISDLSYDETVRWMVVSTTRRYSVKNGSALIPVSELLNTAINDQLNTEWTVKDHEFKMVAKMPVGAGEELFDAYCTDCANDAMLVTWGLLLADNPNPVTTSAKCPELQAPTMAAFGVDSAAALPSLAKAKCETTDGKRCSFAKLALEHCAEKWSGKTSLVEKAEVATVLEAAALRAQQALEGSLARGGTIEVRRTPA